MFKELLKNSGWFGKLFQLLLFSLLFLMIGSLLWHIIYGNSTSIASQKTLQLISAVFFFIIPVFFLSYSWYEKPLERLWLKKSPTTEQILLVIVLMFFIQPFVNLTGFLNEQIHLPAALNGVERFFTDYETKSEQLVNNFLAVKTVGGFLFNLFLIALLPAFSEELFFRGAVQNIFSEKFSKQAAIWVAAIIFSLIHVEMSGFFPRMLLGAMFGYILVWSKTLWLPVLAHFINNAIGVTAGFLKPENTIDIQKIEDFGKADTFVYGILSALITISILFMIYKTSKKK